MPQVYFADLTSSNCSRQVDVTLLQNQLQLRKCPVHRSLLTRAKMDKTKKKLHKVKTSAFSNI